MTKVDDDFKVMDALHAFTFNDRKFKVRPAGMAGQRGMVIPVSPDTHAVQLKLRAKLREAQRFVLDDDAVRLTCNLSLEVKRLPGWSVLARLPYDTCWFEYDVKTKLRELARLDRLNGPLIERDPMIPDRLGYLMYREQTEGDCQRWIAHFYALHRKIGVAEIVPGMLAFIFDPEGNPMFPVRGSSVWQTPTLSLRPELGDISARESGKYDADPEVVLTGLPIEGEKGTIIIGDRLENPHWLSGRVAAIVDPWWEANFRTLKMTPHDMGRTVGDEVIENAGHMRWLITMLAAIGGLPRSIRDMHPRPGKHTVGMNQLAYFRSSGLTISIPKGDRVLRAKTLLDKQAKNSLRAWHRVIGHWRVIERGKRTYMCSHSPVLQDHGLALCERCGLLVRRIKAHSRGDPNIGIVDHKYTVTA
jgi:hypothetical protein